LSSIEKIIEILHRQPDQENYLVAENFVPSLYPLIKNNGNNLNQLECSEIFKLILNQPRDEDEEVEIEHVDVTPPKYIKTISDEGYNSPIAKQELISSHSSPQFQPIRMPYPSPIYNSIGNPYFSFLPFFAQNRMFPPMMSHPSDLVVNSDERKYTRHAKPPYSYSSIIMLALLTDEKRALPLREIVRR
jgi:hypothetical protein